MSAWQPIETAPKDGTLILAYGIPIGEVYGRWSESFPVIVSWEYGEWSSPTGDCYSLTLDATHWMPIPPPPAEEAKR